MVSLNSLLVLHNTPNIMSSALTCTPPAKMKNVSVYKSKHVLCLRISPKMLVSVARQWLE